MLDYLKTIENFDKIHRSNLIRHIEHTNKIGVCKGCGKTDVSLCSDDLCYVCELKKDYKSRLDYYKNLERCRNNAKQIIAENELLSKRTLSKAEFESLIKYYWDYLKNHGDLIEESNPYHLKFLEKESRGYGNFIDIDVKIVNDNPTFTGRIWVHGQPYSENTSFNTIEEMIVIIEELMRDYRNIIFVLSFSDTLQYYYSHIGADGSYYLDHIYERQI